MTRTLNVPDPRRIFADHDRRIGILERRIDPDKGEAPRQRAPFITVAAADTPVTMAVAATYRCNGSNDQDQINAAMGLAGASGGTVHLLGGTFTLGAQITSSSNATVTGSGPETVVVAPTGGYAFAGTSASTWSLSNMTISVPATATGGVYLDGSTCEVYDLIITGAAYTSGYGIRTLLAAVRVTRCRISTLLFGIYATNGTCHTVANHITNCGTGGYYDSTSNNVIAANVVSSIRNHGLQGVSGANSNNIYGNELVDIGLATAATYSGIHWAGFSNYIHGNVFRGTSAAYGVTVTGFYTDNWVAMNDWLGGYATAGLFDNAISTVTFPGNRPFSASGTVLGHVVKDEGVALTQRAAINFVGDSVVATDDAANNETDVTISHLASATHSGAQPVTVRKNSGANVGTRSRLNLIEGTNVTLTVADDGTDGEVDITIAAAANGGGTVTDAFVPYYLGTGETFSVPEFRQALYVEPIELDGGTLDVEGLLIEVDQPPDLSALVHMGVC
jgi:hypothetical protein